MRAGPLEGSFVILWEGGDLQPILDALFVVTFRIKNPLSLFK